MENIKNFSYNEMITRNIGFFSPDDQDKIKKSQIFIVGVGGMGGAALESLARLGVENFILADFDIFEISNLNRQILCTLDTIGQEKIIAAQDRALMINPNIKIKTYGKDWINSVDSILEQVDFVINGCDDTKSTIALMRRAKHKNKTVIDAYASSLPNVYVVKPNDRRPEQRLEYKTENLTLDEITPEIEKQCLMSEIVHVLASSSSGNHIVWKYAVELITGKRKRFSMSAMVITTGNLMAFEALKIILNKKQLASSSGYFFNPWIFKIEKQPLKLIYNIKKFLIRKEFKKMN